MMMSCLDYLLINSTTVQTYGWPNLLATSHALPVKRGMEKAPLVSYKSEVRDARQVQI